MRIKDLLQKEGIELGVSLSSKQEVIDKLISLQEKSGNIDDLKVYKEAILAREAMSSTAVGNGIAIPHAKSDSVKKPGLSAVTVPDGVNYESLDGNPTNIAFMIAAPNDGDLHLEVLSRLMTILMDEKFRADLLAAKNTEEFIEVIDKKESEKYPQEAKAVTAEGSGYRVLAVTACPTGIAHTYMAAEALEKAGEKLGLPLKAETNGSGGAKNVLTDAEIEAADGIIIAADKSVDMARFNGKRVISVPVTDGIKRPEELIKQITEGDVPVYKHAGKIENRNSDKEGFGRQIYKHLMNGVSHMLPFVVAGGIFIALAFLIDTLCGNAGTGSDFGTVAPAAAFFKTIGGYAFNVMVPILAGFIAMSIADRPGLLVGFVGGLLATSGATFANPGGDVPSGFLGALLAGFIGGYMMLGLRKLCEKLPKALEGIKPVLIYPLLGLAGISVFMCAINPIMGVINTGMNNGLTWLSDRNLAIPLGALLGGMMAIDMGGPFNKAAYTFATLGLAASTVASQEIMAAVMIGGMVPPLAIAIASAVFKNKFTKEERKNAPVNYIMGLSFITEGAIPYAAADPGHVIPSCIVGSAVAGALSMIFKCTLPAPHGGIFVLAVVGNWYLYLLALAIGAVVGAAMLGILKKKIKED